MCSNPKSAARSKAIDNVGPQDFATVQADTNLKLLPREALNVMYIGMNNTYPPFDKIEVRQAIAMGIDRARIIEVRERQVEPRQRLVQRAFGDDAPAFHRHQVVG